MVSFILCGFRKMFGASQQCVMNGVSTRKLKKALMWNSNNKFWVLVETPRCWRRQVWELWDICQGKLHKRSRTSPKEINAAVTKAGRSELSEPFESKAPYIRGGTPGFDIWSDVSLISFISYFLIVPHFLSFEIIKHILWHYRLVVCNYLFYLTGSHS